MGILRFSHLGICVSDLARSEAFYRDALGFARVSSLRVEGEPTATLLGLGLDVLLEALYLERDGVCIELLHFESPQASGSSHEGGFARLGLTHLSLRVADLAGTLDQLERQGVQVRRSSLIHNPEFGSGAVFISDPDGTRIELVESPGDPNRPPGT